MIKWFRQKSIIRQQNVRTRYFTRLSLPILPRITLKTTQQLNVGLPRLILDCKTLTLTELGRNLPTKARTKHNIKRIDRLLGNRHLHKERLAVYRWHASFICSGNTMPIVLVDWSDIREQNGLWYCELQSHYTVVLLLFMRKRSAFRAMFKESS
jgi:hypothetical protein